MKKFVCSLLMGGLLLVGSTVGAADLPLADGHVLPLGSAISIHQGKDSYMTKDWQTTLTSPEMEKTLLKAMEKNKEFTSFSEADKKMLVQELCLLFKNFQVSQMVSDTGDHVYQAFVLSFPLTEESFNHWTTIGQQLAPEKAKNSLPNLTWKDVKAFLSMPITTEGTVEQSVIPLGQEVGTLLLQQGYWQKKVSKSGIPYQMYTLYTTQQNSEMLTPLYLCLLSTSTDKQIGFTVILTNQTDGVYFDSYIQKALEVLK